MSFVTPPEWRGKILLFDELMQPTHPHPLLQTLKSHISHSSNDKPNHHTHCVMDQQNVAKGPLLGEMSWTRAPPSLETTSSGQCDCRDCTKPMNAPSSCMISCLVDTCAKQIHLGCHETLLLGKHLLHPLIDSTNGLKLFVCSKTCHNKVKNSMVD